MKDQKEIRLQFYSDLRKLMYCYPIF